jgi:hypothetical protein
MVESELRRLSLTGIAHRCAQESDLFFKRQPHDPCYCFELFRRAIVHSNQQAWELLYRQYHPLVLGWVHRHDLFASSGEEADYFVNGAFEKMWTRLTPTTFDRFPDLKSILRYLQMCVNSAIVDAARSREQVTRLEDVEPALVVSSSKTAGQGEAFVDLERAELWGWLYAQLKDVKEEQAVYGTYVLGLKPQELFSHYRNTFRDVNEVYRVKENVLDRLRRDKSAEEFLSGP